MATTTGGRQVRVRVHRALATAEVNEDSLESGKVFVKSVVGEVDADGTSRVVWIRGGASHSPARLKRDSPAALSWIDVADQEVYRIPSTMREEMVLLAHDMAIAIHIAKMVAPRELGTIAILTKPQSATLARLLVAYFLKTPPLSPGGGLKIHVVAAGGVHAQAYTSSDYSSPSVILHSDPIQCDALLLDGCIDFCGDEDSLSFATSQLEPLGTLISFNPERPAVCELKQSNGFVPVDMNRIVVNELTLLHVGDFRGEMADAVAFLSSQPGSSLDLVTPQHELVI